MDEAAVEAEAGDRGRRPAAGPRGDAPEEAQVHAGAALRRAAAVRWHAVRRSWSASRPRSASPLAYGLVQAVVAVRSVLVLLLVAAFLAIGLDPTVRRLERSGLRRGQRGRRRAGGRAAVLHRGRLRRRAAGDRAGRRSSSTRSRTTCAELQRRPAGGRAGPALRAAGPRAGDAGPARSSSASRRSAVCSASAWRAERLLQRGDGAHPDALLPVQPAGLKTTAYHLVPRSRRPRVVLLSDEILDRVGGYVAGALVVARRRRRCRPSSCCGARGAVPPRPGGAGRR